MNFHLEYLFISSNVFNGYYDIKYNFDRLITSSNSQARSRARQQHKFCNITNCSHCDDDDTAGSTKKITKDYSFFKCN